MTNEELLHMVEYLKTNQSISTANAAQRIGKLRANIEFYFENNPPLEALKLTKQIFADYDIPAHFIWHLV